MDKKLLSLFSKCKSCWQYHKRRLSLLSLFYRNANHVGSIISRSWSASKYSSSRLVTSLINVFQSLFLHFSCFSLWIPNSLPCGRNPQALSQQKNLVTYFSTSLYAFRYIPMHFLNLFFSSAFNSVCLHKSYCGISFVFSTVFGRTTEIRKVWFEARA